MELRELIAFNSTPSSSESARGILNDTLFAMQYCKSLNAWRSRSSQVQAIIRLLCAVHCLPTTDCRLNSQAASACTMLGELVDNLSYEDVQLVFYCHKALSGRSRRDFVFKLPMVVVEPHMLKSMSQSCSVCLESARIGDALRKLPCGHCFHVQCIDLWLYKNDTCPLCRGCCCL